ncbi:MAG: type II toxin-antitoxin system HicA family toxin [Planctomycetota bacterium]|mgnify:CR=1 FL=1
MKIPRDVGGEELIKLLARFGYSITRQTGSHIRLTSSMRGTEHHITIPRHNPLKVGTLNGILKDVASYLEIDRQQFIIDLFKK